MHHDGISLHNVAELIDVDHRQGQLLQRVPEAVRRELNEGARERYRHPAGVELRFVPDGEVTVTLSARHGPAQDATEAHVFWGPFQQSDTVEIASEPTTVRVSMPETLRNLDPDVVAACRFDPSVCRIVLPGCHRGGRIAIHDVDGERRPPMAGELPDVTFLAYGTSITEGERATAEQLTYVSRAAIESGTDALNLGTSGSAYCEAAMAEHIAGRDDWDVATLALSVNMLGQFDAETFRERARHMVETVANANPERPVLAITLYPNDHDLCDPGSDAADGFRRILRELVDASAASNLHLLEGQDLLATPGGLTTDLVHPGDQAMIEIGRRLANEIDRLAIETVSDA